MSKRLQELDEHDVQSFLDTMDCGCTLRRLFYEALRAVYEQGGAELKAALLRHFGDDSRVQFEHVLWHFCTRPGDGVRMGEEHDKRRLYLRLRNGGSAASIVRNLVTANLQTSNRDYVLDWQIPDDELWVCCSPTSPPLFKLKRVVEPVESSR
jgi:hypothetical protein